MPLDQLTLADIFTEQLTDRLTELQHLKKKPVADRQKNQFDSPGEEGYGGF